MSRVCIISGKRPLVGNNVSKSHRKTKRRQFPNLQTKKIYIPELNKTIKVKLSVAALKTIDKIYNTGIDITIIGSALYGVENVEKRYYQLLNE